MKNNIKSRNIICIVLVAVLLFATKVYAANDSFQTTLSANNSSVKRGENVIVTIGLKDIAIESGEKGIGAYTAKIDFDSSVLEYESAKGTDNWEAPFYQENLIVGNTTDGKVIKTQQSIGTITFKVKENAKLGETIIKLTNFSGSTASTDVMGNDSTVMINVINKDNETGNQGETGNQSGNGTGTQSGSENQGESGTNSGTVNQNGSGTGAGSITENGNNQNIGNNSGSSNNKENSQTQKLGILPKTGKSNTLIYILLSISVIIAMIFLVKIKLINRKINKNC